ncbi:MAG: hypothetical protein GY754_29735 [bacterium]|nr:hypothetical protein [bacterium]
MIIKTTINFRVPVLEKINEAAVSLGISRTKIIIRLLKMVMNEKDFSPTMCRPVQYQLDDPDPDNWHTFHISFQEDDFEFFLDLRKFLKKSVSAVVAYAVEEYLDIIMGLTPEDPSRNDSYRFRHYVISSSEMHGVISWQLFWGLPEKTADLLQCRLI